MVYMLFDFIGKAFGLLFWFLDGIFYFVGQLFLVLIKVVMLFCCFVSVPWCYCSRFFEDNWQYVGYACFNSEFA